MKAWTEWETTRRQVAIAGRILDDRDRPLPGADVTITATAVETPPGTAGHKWVGSLAKADGIYYFLDLPGGTYTVRAVHTRSGTGGEKAVSSSWSKDGRVAMAVADLKLSSTGTR